MISNSNILELNRRRSIAELILSALDIYRRTPWLFLVSALVVIVPYDIVVLMATDRDPFGHLIKTGTILGG